MWSERMNTTRIADELGLPEKELNDLLFSGTVPESIKAKLMSVD
jgi:hypothetical protein